MRGSRMDQGGQERATVVCDVHPEVRVPEGQPCPRCRNAAETGPAEAAVYPRRFWAACAGGAAVAIAALGRDGSAPDATAGWSAPVLSVLTVLVVTALLGWVLLPLVQATREETARGKTGVFVPALVAIAVLHVWSCAAFLAADLLPEVTRPPDTSVLGFLAVGPLVAALVHGRLLWERRGHEFVGAYVHGLLESRPTVARIVGSGGEDGVAVRFVEAGDRVRVLAGERIPVDGNVIAGHSVVDESELIDGAGDVEKGPGSRVLAGTVNGRDVLLVRAVRPGADSIVVRLGRAMSEIRRRAVPFREPLPMVQRHWLAVVFAAAALAALAVAFAGVEPRAWRALLAAAGVLVAAPPRLFAYGARLIAGAAVSCGARFGLFVSGARALERLGLVNTLVVDRTGMLTEGSPQLTTIIALPPWEETEIVRIAASLERESDHPIAAALCAAAEGSELALTETRNVRTVPGKGIAGIVGRHKVAIGGRVMLEELRMPEGDLLAAAQDLRSEAQTVLYVLVDDRLAALLGMTDVAGAAVPAMVKSLRDAGVQVVMLTGDSRTTGTAVARELGIDAVLAEVQPKDKPAIVQRLQEEGRVVALVGNGEADAEALAQADVALITDPLARVPGAGSHVALAEDSLQAVVAAVLLGRRARSASRRGYLVTALLTAAAVLLALPAAAWGPFGVTLPPLLAALPLLCSAALTATALRLRDARL